MLLFKIIFCFQLALYLLFGAILYFPLKLLKIKDEISNQISFDDANAMGSIETLPNSTENLIEMSQPIITSGTLETYSTANTTMMTSTSRPLTSCITKGCGLCEDVTSEDGTLSSPGYPGDYGNDRACVYIIRVDPGRTIHLSFPAFSVEEDFDWIDVYNGVNEVISANITRGTSLTGYVIPYSIRSSSNVMTIHFVSDIDNTQILPGVTGRWQAIYKVI